ncbi:hypothetical protein EK904_013063 [Melospiza melodia maxima]|nr:hypothetical protein EK904_013063 [Melospiza melodia maxima]
MSVRKKNLAQNEILAVDVQLGVFSLGPQIQCLTPEWFWELPNNYQYFKNSCPTFSRSCNYLQKPDFGNAQGSADTANCQCPGEAAADPGVPYGVLAESTHGNKAGMGIQPPLLLFLCAGTR